MVASKVAPAKGSVKDSIDRVLDSYDKNDDGRFDKNEVRAIALELVGERRAASSLRKIVMVLAVALLVAIGVNFASIIIGVELTKESTVDGTTGVLSPSGHKDTAAITGSLAVGVSVQDARRRRLKESHGRALVSVADVAACAPTIQAATIASTFTGSIRLANAAGFTIHPGHVVAEEQDASGSTMYTVQGNNEDEPPYVVLPVSGSTSCEVSMEVNARRGLALEAPTAENATEWRRRLTQRAPEAGWSGGMPGCIVFDCFEGDEGCSEPSPHEACLLWSTDGDRCIEPACRLREQAGRRRLSACFPSHTNVIREDGATVRMDELHVGDRILAANTAGELTFDDVSIFSLAQPDTEATFYSLTTAAGKSLSLTKGHRVPVGDSCCSNLKQAKELREGEAVWVADSAGIQRDRITKIELSIERGLHNPLMTHGAFPVAGGVVTAFNRIEIVSADAALVPPVAAFCAATGTCTAARALITAAECALVHAAHLLTNGALAGGNLCKTFHYIDGPVCHAGWCAAPRAAELHEQAKPTAGGSCTTA